MFYKKIRIIKDDKLFEGKLDLVKLASMVGVTPSYIYMLIKGSREANEETYNKIKAAVSKLRKVDERN